MHEEKVLAQIDTELASLKEQRDKCDEFLKTARGEKKDKLERARAALEAGIYRLAACKDIIAGRAFILRDEEDNQIVVVKPEGVATARLLDLAEKLGARLVKVDA